ncbi:hypothetical protein ACI3PL_31790, partial [Lacticaseibacillus paracasei]
MSKSGQQPALGRTAKGSSENLFLSPLLRHLFPGFHPGRYFIKYVAKIRYPSKLSSISRNSF